MTEDIQAKKNELFAQWITVAQEFSAGKKSLLEYARTTIETAAILTPYPAGERHPVWIPLEDIMQTAEVLSPNDIEHGLLSQNSITQGYERFLSAGLGIMEYGCTQKLMTVSAATNLLKAMGDRQKQIATLAA